MPTRRQRLNLTLSDEIDKMLTELSELQGCPKAAVVVNMLEGVKEPLKKTIRTLRAAQNAPDKLFNEVTANLDKIPHSVQTEIERLSE